MSDLQKNNRGNNPERGDWFRGGDNRGAATYTDNRRRICNMTVARGREFDDGS